MILEGWILTGIIGLKSDDKIAEWIHDQRVAAYGHSGEGRVTGSIVNAGVLGGAHENLEVVSVKMERMFSRVVVVQNDVHGLAFLQDEGVRVGAVDYRIDGRVAGRQG